VRGLLKDQDSHVEWLLLDAEAIIDIDVSAADVLRKLHAELERRGIVLAIARASLPLQKTLRRSGIVGLIGEEHLYPSVRTGVQAYLDQKDHKEEFVTKTNE